MKQSEKKKLFEAVENEDLKTLKKLLKDGYDIEAENPYGLTPLMVAVDYSLNDVVTFLLEEGVNVNAQTEESLGRTPLMFASTNKSAKNVKPLLSAGADIETKDTFGRTALVCAYKWGNTKAQKLLEDAGATISKSIKDQILLAYAIKNDDTNTIKKLVKKGVDLDNLHESEEFRIGSAVTVAVARHSDKKRHAINYNKLLPTLKTLELLFSLGADPDTKDGSGFPALTRACNDGNKEVVACLLAHGADPNETDGNGGRNALYFALFPIKKRKKEYLEIADMICKAGVNIGHKSNGGNTVFDHAEKHGNEQIVTFLSNIK